MKDYIFHEVTLDMDELIDSLLELDEDSLFEFIVALESVRQDWGLTKRLYDYFVHRDKAEETHNE